MKYCLRCNEAVQEEERYKHIQGGEYVRVSVCPFCGWDLLTEMEPCPICGEAMQEGKSACLRCMAEIMVGISHLTDRFRTKAQSRMDIWGTILDISDDITEMFEREEKREKWNQSRSETPAR